MGNYISDERFLDRECVKRTGLPIKANHINSVKYDSDSGDLEGLQKLRNQYHSNPLIGY